MPGEEYMVALGHIQDNAESVTAAGGAVVAAQRPKKGGGLWSGFKQMFNTKPRAAARPRRQFSNDLQSLGYNCLGSGTREDDDTYRHITNQAIHLHD